MKYRVHITLIFVCLFVATSAQAFDSFFGPLLALKTAAKEFRSHESGSIISAPATGQIDVAFSPDGASEALVLKVINSAKHTIRLAAYSFTSVPVVRALLAAERRGVEVAVVVDYKNNIVQDRSGKARAALNLLVNAGIPARTISIYPIHHDKYIIADGLHVETGSFNYSYSAAHRNSENVLVVWNNPELAATYLKHWQNRYERGVDYRSTY